MEYGEHRFCFHAPYSTARKWMKSTEALPRKVRGWGKEEGCPFDRPISEFEARAVSLEEVIRELEFFAEGQ